MCMRKLFEDEEVGGVLLKTNNKSNQPEHQDLNEDKLTKAKNRYIKQHEEMLLREAEIARQNEKSEEIIVPVIHTDALAKCTFYYSVLINLISKSYSAWKHSPAYKILFYTTQPAHVIMIAAVLCVTSAMVPSTERTNIAGQPHSRTASFIYLTSFVIHFGAQIWMTFVSGLTLYFALPRHSFGEVQRVLFPRYFSLNACLSLITLLIFVKHHPMNTWDTEIAIQVFGMSGAFFLELLIRLYLTPPLLRLIIQKNALERAAGVGTEIGRHNPGPLKHCPHYLIIHRAFRRVHVTIAMGNMVTMACTVLHLHYISSKLCVL
ncbi:transmembrane protein 205 [Neodiprion pinetum]|uniref:Transmembrane protein 205 n=1 Tax=Neodiprion lecontei TaxID=441921 RepID=A0A6J0BSS4_NEOLC|nr:transmembrane protein 205 [Neodiprion lecontei]XP_046475479.1 transmembrane protein 205 [Neodiprion pinetum]